VDTELKVLFGFLATGLPVSILASRVALSTDDPWFLILHAVPIAGAFAGLELVPILKSPDPVKRFGEKFNECVSNE
jgi:hypothetical protein